MEATQDFTRAVPFHPLRDKIDGILWDAVQPVLAGVQGAGRKGGNRGGIGVQMVASTDLVVEGATASALGRKSRPQQRSLDEYRLF